MSKPSTTTYAVLALLAGGPHSAYELARLMDRSVRYYWPRAVSRVYEEPKKLVAAGWATVSTQGSGMRRRSVYQITDEGRDALRRWLAEPGAGPQLEFEGLLKVLGAEYGDVVSLRATLDRIEADTLALQALGRSLAQRALAGDPELIEIAHVRVLTWRFLWEHTHTVLHWVDWARSYISSWEDTGRTPARTRAGLEQLHAALSANQPSAG